MLPGLSLLLAWIMIIFRIWQAAELARIILSNYHPDLNCGSKNILVIVRDMNYIWREDIFT